MYVVLVGGRAVPAAVAARDMRLVRDAEVAKELGAVVTTKSEREYDDREHTDGVISNILVYNKHWSNTIVSTLNVNKLFTMIYAHRFSNNC